MFSQTPVPHHLSHVLMHGNALRRAGCATEGAVAPALCNLPLQPSWQQSSRRSYNV